MRTYGLEFAFTSGLAVGDYDGDGFPDAVVRAKLRKHVQTKQVFAGTSFASGNSPWLTFGLGRRDSIDLRVSWPSGLVEECEDVASGALVTLVEGTGTPDND